MATIDVIIFFLYMAGMLAFGYYFLRKNEGADDYYAGGRNMGSLHTGLSVVATNVGGGFAIGLGEIRFCDGIVAPGLRWLPRPDHLHRLWLIYQSPDLGGDRKVTSHSRQMTSRNWHYLTL